MSIQTTTVFGSCVQLSAVEDYQHGWARLERDLGPLRVRRVYDAGRGLTTALNVATVSAPKGQTVIASWHDDPKAIISGSLDAFYRQQFTRVTSNVILCYWHEADAAIKQGRTTTAEHKAAWARLHRLWKDAGGRGRWVQIFTGWNFATRFPSQYVGDGLCDIVGVDPYAAPGVAASSLVEPLLDEVAKVTAKPVAVTEIGGWYTPQSLGFVQSLAGLRGLVPYVCWFNSTGTGPTAAGNDYRLTTPELQAAYRALTHA